MHKIDEIITDLTEVTGQMEWIRMSVITLADDNQKKEVDDQLNLIASLATLLKQEVAKIEERKEPEQLSHLDLTATH